MAYSGIQSSFYIKFICICSGTVFTSLEMLTKCKWTTSHVILAKNDCSITLMLLMLILDSLSMFDLVLVISKLLSYHTLFNFFLFVLGP